MRIDWNHVVEDIGDSAHPQAGPSQTDYLSQGTVWGGIERRVDIRLEQRAAVPVETFANGLLRRLQILQDIAIGFGSYRHTRVCRRDAKRQSPE